MQRSAKGAAQPSFDVLPHSEKLECLRELATNALKLYDVGTASAPVLVNLSENATYLIDDPASGRRWALRVHREGYHSKTAIASELAWLNALRDDGVVTTPTPLPGRNGGFIQQSSHPAMARPRNVVLFEWEGWL